MLLRNLVLFQEYILPKYSAFHDKYANVDFSKHPEKYIKYTPAQVSSAK